jgi:hypothetical protein
MANYALVNDNGGIDRYSSSIDPNGGTETGWRWLPVIDTKPDYDDGTQVRTGPVVTVNANDVTRVWSVRARTAEELDAIKDEMANDAAVTVLGKVLFNHENRIRALNSQAPITAAQFKTAVKALI